MRLNELRNGLTPQVKPTGDSGETAGCRANSESTAGTTSPTRRSKSGQPAS